MSQVCLRKTGMPAHGREAVEGGGVYLVGISTTGNGDSVYVSIQTQESNHSTTC